VEKVEKVLPRAAEVMGTQKKERSEKVDSSDTIIDIGQRA